MQGVFNKIELLNFELYNFDGQKIDISRIFLRVDIYENIFNQFLTGKIVILDTQDIISKFPIIGNELIKITVKHENEIVDLEFNVYKIESDGYNTKGIHGSKYFVLYFCSREKLYSTKISRKYTDKSEVIIPSLLDSPKEFLFEPTLNEIEFYSNFWEIKKIINFIIKLSKSKSYYDFVFYETLQNFNFFPVSFLLKQPVSEKFVFDTSNSNILMNNNIKVFRFENYFNILKDQNFGFFGMTQYQNHNTDYSYTKTENDLLGVYDKITALGKNVPFDDNLLNSSEKVINNYYDIEISPIRTAMMNLLNHYNLIIKVQGTLTRKVGQIIDLRYPKFNNKDIFQKSFNGNWFINGIHYSFDNGGAFDQNLLLSKNAKFDFDKLTKTTERNM